MKPAPIKRKRYVFVSEAPPEEKVDDNADENEGEDADDDAKEEPKKQKLERAKKPIKVVKPTYARTSSHPALHYLRAWGAKNADWKFQKVRQMYLLHNMYNANRISGMLIQSLPFDHTHSLADADFKIMLEYLRGMKGSGRTLTLKQAQDIVAGKVTVPVQPPDEFDDKVGLYQRW